MAHPITVMAHIGPADRVNVERLPRHDTICVRAGDVTLFMQDIADLQRLNDAIGAFLIGDEAVTHAEAA